MALTNEIKLVGFCGCDAKLKNSYNGTLICKLPVYTEHWVFNNGQQQKHKEMHWCVFLGKNAERAKRLIMKGSQIFLRGSMHYHKFIKNGQDVVYPQVMVEEFVLPKAMVTKELYEQIMNNGQIN